MVLPTKAHRQDTRGDHAHDLLLIRSEMEAISTVAMVHA